MAITLKANVRWGGVDYAPGATIPGLTPSDEAGLVSSNRAEWVGTPSTTSNGAVPVMATTGPGGGVRLLADGRSVLRRQFLLEAFPLPVMHTILDPHSVDVAQAGLPGGATISIVDAPDEMYGKAIRIDLPAGLTSLTGRIRLPLRPGLDGLYPAALPRTEWRVRCDDWTSVTQCLAVLSNDGVSLSTVGYSWVLVEPSVSQFGLRGPHAERWNDTYRTFVTSAYLQRGVVGSPPAWEPEQNNFEVRAVRLTVQTSAPTTLYINRVACPAWSRGAIITQMDGGYAQSYGPVFKEYQRRGWPGVASFLGDGEPESVSYESRKEMIASGWDVCQHVAALSGAVPPVASALSGSQSADDMRRIITAWRQMAARRGYLFDGAQTSSHLTGASASTINDAAAIYRAAGLKGGRGPRLSDAEFGVDPYSAATNAFNLSAPWPGGWSPRWGRWNRHAMDVVLDRGTPALRDIYVGSALETLVNRVAVGADLGWVYIHRVQPLTESTPDVGNCGPNFARDYIARLDELAHAGSVLPISATEADYLTYDRPGDVHLRWDGAWVSRTTGKVVL